MPEAQARQKFRFGSKKEYERELSRLISLRDSLQTKKTKVKPTTESVEEEYEGLMEEYLSFCSTERDG